MTVVINGTTGITSVNGTAAAPSVTGTDTDTGIVYGTNTLSLATGGTTAVTVDSSQNVGIGTSSPAANAKLSVAGNIYIGGNVVVGSPSGGTNGSCNLSGGNAFAGGTGAAMSLRGYTNGYNNGGIEFYYGNGTTTVEAARIDSSGNFYVGGTTGNKRANFIGTGTDITYTNTDGPYSWNAGPLGTTGTGRFNWYYATSSVDRMYLTTAGALYNSTGTYGTISDVSLKENIVDATPKLDDVMRLRVRNYNMKSDPDKKKVIGVVAQEIEEVFPGLVEETVNRVALEDGSFDATTVKAVKYSVLTTILVKAIQEQQAIIEQLRADVEALKAA